MEGLQVVDYPRTKRCLKIARAILLSSRLSDNANRGPGHPGESRRLAGDCPPGCACRITVLARILTTPLRRIPPFPPDAHKSCTVQAFKCRPVSSTISAGGKVATIHVGGQNRSASPSRHGRTRMTVFPARRSVELKAATASSRGATVPMFVRSRPSRTRWTISLSWARSDSRPRPS